MKDMKANIQLMDNYVKEYNFNLKERITETTGIILGCNIVFEINNIREEENEKIAQVAIEYNIDMNKKENNKIGKIHIIMQALFSINKELEESEIEAKLKYEGAPILYQLALVYINANTALSGIPAIKPPLIDFKQFFKTAKKETL